jgi:hypothetical protein
VTTSDGTIVIDATLDFKFSAALLGLERLTSFNPET